MRLAALALLLSVSPVIAAGMPAKPGQNFLEAYKMLQADGWAGGPGPATGASRCSIGFDEICNDQRFKSAVITCRGTGLSGCMFVFWKDEQTVVVDTAGEELDVQKVRSVKVMSEAQLEKFYAKRGY